MVYKGVPVFPGRYKFSVSLLMFGNTTVVDHIEIGGINCHGLFRGRDTVALYDGWNSWL